MGEQRGPGWGPTHAPCSILASSLSLVCPAGEGSCLLGLSVPAPPPAPRKEPRSRTAGRPHSGFQPRFFSLEPVCHPPQVFVSSVTPMGWTCPQSLPAQPRVKALPSLGETPPVSRSLLAFHLQLSEAEGGLGWPGPATRSPPSQRTLRPRNTPSWSCALFGDTCRTRLHVTPRARDVGQMTFLCQGNQGFPTRET